MRYALLLIFAAGCNAPEMVNKADIIAALAVRYAAIAVNPPSAPSPDQPTGECVEGCRCNGTGKEKTGDGLATVDCRCPDSCKCKQQSDPAADPPLVTVEQDDCATGNCQPAPKRRGLFRR
jgi:hypothetical protein